LHLAVATPNYKVLEHFNDFAYSWVLDLVNEPPRIDTSAGCFTLPDRAGLARHTLARKAASNCSKQAGSVAASVLRGQGVRAV
jgi:galactonate dehydratase